MTDEEITDLLKKNAIPTGPHMTKIFRDLVEQEGSERLALDKMIKWANLFPGDKP